ncbi:MAG: flagellar biosynthetic protein FliO [Treponema sp.]|nr:flagellar biosynthetic protein FliO [Treponema sp.]
MLPAAADIVPQARSAETPNESAIILGEAAPGTSPSPVSSGFVVFRMVLVLALVAAAVYGAVFFIRRASRPRDSRNPHLKILTSAHLGSNRFVYVVNVGNQAWLVGAGEGGVSLISEITDKDALDTMLLEDSQKQAESPGGRFPDFRTLLRRFGGGVGPDLPPDKPDFSADNVRKNRERLRGL